MKIICTCNRRIIPVVKGMLRCPCGARWPITQNTWDVRTWFYGGDGYYAGLTKIDVEELV